MRERLSCFRSQLRSAGPYGFVGHVGYAKQVAYTDPERSLAATTGVLVGIGLVIFYRHIINGRLLDALQQWFEQTLNNANPWVMLFFGIPLTLLVISAGLAGTIGGFVGAAKGIGRLLYYLPRLIHGTADRLALAICEAGRAGRRARIAPGQRD